MPKVVPGSGPLNAPLLWIGEAPGVTEVKRGAPFVGASGKKIRSIMRHNDIDLDQARINNVVPFNPGLITGQNRDRLVTQCWDNITDDLTMSKAKVIVACGGVALRRLTGLTNITNESGGVIPVRDLPSGIMLSKVEYKFGLPKDALIIPVIPPAGIMKTKIGAGWDHFERVMTRVSRYVKGSLTYNPVTPQLITGFTADALDRALSETDVCVIDTEYDVETHVPFLIGLATTETAAQNKVYSFKPHERYNRVLAKHFQRTDLLKVAHNYMADVRALHTINVNWCQPTFCTMLAFSILYPDLRIGLNHVAAFYLNDIRNWKDMPHTDPGYNALDVMNTWRIFKQLRIELAQNGMLDLFYNEGIPSAPVCEAMEIRGMRVDTDKQTEMLEDNEQDYIQASEEIFNALQDVVDKQAKQLAWNKTCAEKDINKLEHLTNIFVFPHACELHEQYNGLRKKRFSADSGCSCGYVYHSVTERRNRIAARKKELTKINTQLTKWTSKGLNIHSPAQLKWLLYDAEAYGLPVQKKHGKITTDADAIAKLKAKMVANIHKPKSKYHKPDHEAIISVLDNIKLCQHLKKYASTFLQPPVDNRGIAHPPYRMWGTGTGRPASGDDAVVSADRGKSTYAFNALNIPEECRGIYVPHKRKGN